VILNYRFNLINRLIAKIVFDQMKQDRRFKEFLLRGIRTKKILNMITVSGSQGWNERGILARIAIRYVDQ
jgi:hypothetical protein